MDRLSCAERELVALGAAMGSNCVPCIQYHIPEARKAGLSDGQIGEAVRLADTVRQVPARKVLTAANQLLTAPQGTDQSDQRASGCAQPAPDGGASPACCA